MLETPIQHAVRDIVAALSARPASDEDTDGIDRVLRLIDKRFMDLVASIPTSTVPSQTRRNATTPTYNLHLKVRAKGRVVHRFSIDVVDAATLQDIADACYFNLEDFVTPYKYLEQWIIRDMTASANIVAHDFMSLVKANAVLRPDHEYEVILLSRPYDPTKGPHQTLD
jgi:hypothetical protein